MKTFALFTISAMALAAASWLYLIELPRLESENRILRSTLSEQGIELPTGIRPSAAPAPASSSASENAVASVADGSLPASAETLPGQNGVAPRSPAEAMQHDAKMLAEEQRASALEAIHLKYMILDTNEFTAKTKLKELNAQRVELDSNFKEYNIVDTVDECGEVTGSQNRGTRTSDADRKKALEPVNEQIDYYTKLLSAIEPARNQLKIDSFAVEAAYRQAITASKRP